VAGELHNPKAILANSNNPYLVIKAVLEQSSGLIFTCQKDFEGHLANLRAVLVRFREYGLKLKPKKCELFQKEVEFLGRVVGPRGIYSRFGAVFRFDFHLPIC
jgi:septation ring formation regulator EzrA